MTGTSSSPPEGGAAPTAAGRRDGDPGADPSPGRVLATVVAVLAVTAWLTWLTVPPPGLARAPDDGLRQLDLLYLDQPAPLRGRLGLRLGRPALVVVCAACRAPHVDVDAQVRVSASRRVARAYGLLRGAGVGPGYAVVDAGGRLRYRTFDPGLVDHAAEIDVLLAAVR